MLHTQGSHGRFAVSIFMWLILFAFTGADSTWLRNSVYKVFSTPQVVLGVFSPLFLFLGGGAFNKLGLGQKSAPSCRRLQLGF